LEDEARARGLEPPTEAHIQQSIQALTRNYTLQKQKYDDAPAHLRWLGGLKDPPPPVLNPARLIDDMDPALNYNSPRNLSRARR
jgi:hypothetical protein